MGWLYDWQSLIAGVLGLGGGGLAYIGVKKQINDLKNERQRTDDRRRSTIMWAVRFEAQRLEIAATAVKSTSAGRKFEILMTIEGGPLLRGERDDMALLGGPVIDLIKQAAEALNQYNTAVSRANAPGPGPRLITPPMHTSLDHLIEAAQKLQGMN
jgi:hypothetical protein